MYNDPRQAGINLLILEMPSEQIMMRMLASLGRINQTKVRTGQLDDDDWARLSSTMGSVDEKW